MTPYKSPSLTLWQAITDEGVPGLGAAAARNAIHDWGGKASDITHLVVTTTSSGCLPGADWELVKLLGLPLSTKRLMMYQAGRLPQRLLRHARLQGPRGEQPGRPGRRGRLQGVYALFLRGPSEDHLGNLVGQAIMGDVAGAVVVGCHPSSDEHGMFELVSTFSGDRTWHGRRHRVQATGRGDSVHPAARRAIARVGRRAPLGGPRIAGDSRDRRRRLADDDDDGGGDDGAAGLE